MACVCWLHTVVAGLPTSLGTQRVRRHHCHTRHGQQSLETRHRPLQQVLSSLLIRRIACIAARSSSSSSSRSRSRRGPSRRCTTMSTVDSTPPELSRRTFGIVSKLIEPLVPWTTRWATPRAIRRSVEWYVYLELKSHVCRCVVVKPSRVPKYRNTYYYLTNPNNPNPKVWPQPYSPYSKC